MVTAELAAALPVLMILVVVALCAVSVAGQRVRAADAAREAARAAARGDPMTGSRLAAASAPGSTTAITRSGDRVSARVRIVVHPMGGWLPALTVVERAVAAVEPGTAVAETGATAETGVPP